MQQAGSELLSLRFPHAAVRAAETLLDRNDQTLAQVRDQQALLQFLQGQFREAEQAALLSLQATQQVTAEQGRDSAVAMCQLRLGTIFLGNTYIYPLFPLPPPRFPFSPSEHNSLLLS